MLALLGVTNRWSSGNNPPTTNYACKFDKISRIRLIKRQGNACVQRHSYRKLPLERVPQKSNWIFEIRTLHMLYFVFEIQQIDQRAPAMACM